MWKSADQSSTEMDSSDFYRNKVMLAPMVRIGTLPTRLLALDYGAGVVYGEEIIDFKIMRCKRLENEILGTVDFIDDNNLVVFRTCPKEKGRLIFQLGSCDPDRALQAARVVEKDVDGIDLNMGCPKEFSLKGGMGAALLTQPLLVRRILSNLVENLSIPVTCKIRVLPSVEETLELVKLIESCGVKAIGVHGRNKVERPQHANRIDFIQAITKACKVPIIANGASGEIETFEDIERFRKETGASSVMVARAAEHNPSIFRSEGLLPVEDVIKKYIEYSIIYDNHISNVKYCIQNMLQSLQSSEKGRRLLESHSVYDVAQIWDMKELYEDRKVERTKMRSFITERMNDALRIKRLKTSHDDGVIQQSVQFTKNIPVFKTNASLPKCLLNDYTVKKGLSKPEYETFSSEKMFYSQLKVDGKVFRNTFLEKNKKSSEQAVALIASLHLNLINSSDVQDCLR